MKEFINHLTERNYQNRRVAFIENGSWAPMATKVMKGMLEKSKNLSLAETEVKISSAINDESRAQIIALAEEFSK
jgi:flavorubredoxin